jgi:hypothetical protein
LINQCLLVTVAMDRVDFIAFYPPNVGPWRSIAKGQWLIPFTSHWVADALPQLVAALIISWASRTIITLELHRFII